MPPEPTPAAPAAVPAAVPAVAVVIPAYRVAPYIAATLASVLAQSLADWECVVVDDGSPDDTAAIVAGFTDPRIRLVRQANAGVSAARNAGWRAARAPAVLFLDGDDLLHPTALARLAAGLAAQPDAALVFGTTLRMDPAGVLEPNQKPLDRHDYASGDVLEAVIVHRRIFSNGGQLLIRRAAIERAGGYDPTLRLSEDWEFFCRLAAQGPCRYLGPQDEVLRHRVRPDSAAPTLSQDWTNHLHAVRKVTDNAALRARFGRRRWRALMAEIEATHMFEAGRQNFIRRRFGPARRLMVRSLLLRPSKRRLVVFAAAQAARLTGRPLLARLRFNLPAPAGEAGR